MSKIFKSGIGILLILNMQLFAYSAYASPKSGGARPSDSISNSGDLEQILSLLQNTKGPSENTLLRFALNRHKSNDGLGLHGQSAWSELVDSKLNSEVQGTQPLQRPILWQEASAPIPMVYPNSPSELHFDLVGGRLQATYSNKLEKFVHEFQTHDGQRFVSMDRQGNRVALVDTEGVLWMLRLDAPVDPNEPTQLVWNRLFIHQVPLMRLGRLDASTLVSANVQPSDIEVRFASRGRENTLGELAMVPEFIGEGDLLIVSRVDQHVLFHFESFVYTKIGQQMMAVWLDVVGKFQSEFSLKSLAEFFSKVQPTQETATLKNSGAQDASAGVLQRLAQYPPETDLFAARNTESVRQIRDQVLKVLEKHGEGRLHLDFETETALKLALIQEDYSWAWRLVLEVQGTHLGREVGSPSPHAYSDESVNRANPSKWRDRVRSILRLRYIGSALALGGVSASLGWSTMFGSISSTTQVGLELAYSAIGRIFPVLTVDGYGAILAASLAWQHVLIPIYLLTGFLLSRGVDRSNWVTTTQSDAFVTGTSRSLKNFIDSKFWLSIESLFRNGMKTGATVSQLHQELLRNIGKKFLAHDNGAQKTQLSELLALISVARHHGINPAVLLAVADTAAEAGIDGKSATQVSTGSDLETFLQNPENIRKMEILADLIQSRLAPKDLERFAKGGEPSASTDSSVHAHDYSQILEFAAQELAKNPLTKNQAAGRHLVGVFKKILRDSAHKMSRLGLTTKDYLVSVAPSKETLKQFVRVALFDMLIMMWIPCFVGDRANPEMMSSAVGQAGGFLMTHSQHWFELVFDGISYILIDLVIILVNTYQRPYANEHMGADPSLARQTVNFEFAKTGPRYFTPEGWKTFKMNLRSSWTGLAHFSAYDSSRAIEQAFAALFATLTTSVVLNVLGRVFLAGQVADQAFFAFLLMISVKVLYLAPMFVAGAAIRQIEMDVASRREKFLAVLELLQKSIDLNQPLLRESALLMARTLYAKNEVDHWIDRPLSTQNLLERFRERPPPGLHSMNGLMMLTAFGGSAIGTWIFVSMSVLSFGDPLSLLIAGVLTTASTYTALKFGNGLLLNRRNAGKGNLMARSLQKTGWFAVNPEGSADPAATAIACGEILRKDRGPGSIGDVGQGK